MALLSTRSPRKTGWRISDSLVHSVNFTSPTSCGMSHVVAFSFLIFCRKASRQCVVAASPHKLTSTPPGRIRSRHGQHRPSVSSPYHAPQVPANQSTFATCVVRVADDHDLLFMHGLELQPLARSLSRVIETRRALGDHTLLVRSLRLGELALATLDTCSL